MFVCVSSCVRYNAGHVQRRSISKRCRYFHQQMVSLRWIERWTARCIRNRSLCVCVYVFVCVCLQVSAGGSPTTNGAHSRRKD